MPRLYYVTGTLGDLIPFYCTHLLPLHRFVCIFVGVIFAKDLGQFLAACSKNTLPVMNSLLLIHPLHPGLWLFVVTPYFEAHRNDRA
jgi:hypothetical protein